MPNTTLTPTTCVLIADQVNDLATSLIAQLLGANYAVIMLVSETSAPEYSNPMPGLHVYRVTALDTQLVMNMMADLHGSHGELQHLLFCTSAQAKQVSRKDMGRARFWTSCFSSYRQACDSTGSMMLLHRSANQHQADGKVNLLPGLSRWWAKQHEQTGLRSNSLCLQGYNVSQVHAQTGSLIKRLMQQPHNGRHYQVNGGSVNMSCLKARNQTSLSLL